MTAVERQRLALDAIKKIFGTKEGEDGVNLFIQHHLRELPKSYWKQYLSTDEPEPAAIIDLLQLISSWKYEGNEYFDFSLPGEVTNYVISVHFDSAGAIDDIVMES